MNNVLSNVIPKIRRPLNPITNVHNHKLSGNIKTYLPHYFSPSLVILKLKYNRYIVT